jgi:hypothetical protein
MAKIKIHSKKIISLLRSETSLLSLSEKFRKKFMPDRRRTSQEVKPRQINFNLARKILNEVFGEYVPEEPKNLSRILFSIDRSRDTEFMQISFGSMMDTDEWGKHVDSPWENFISLPVVFYIAATYNKFTFEILQSHLEELKVLYSELDLIFGEKDYLEVVKKYNKKLPGDVKLWLELNH